MLGIMPLVSMSDRAGRNGEFLAIKSLRDPITGQFNVPHTISEGFSQRPQPLPTVKLHDD